MLSLPKWRAFLPRDVSVARYPLKRELLLRPIGTTVYVMPPYILDNEMQAFLATRTRETFDATVAEDL